MLNTQKTSTETMDAIVIAYSPFESTALLRLSEDPQIIEKNGQPILLYICGANNSFIKNIRAVLDYEKKED